MKRSLIIVLAIMVVLLVFAIQNSLEVNIKFLFWDFYLLVSVIVIITLLLGGGIGFVLSLPLLKSKNKKIDELNNVINEFREKQRKIVEEEETKNLEKEENTESTDSKESSESNIKKTISPKDDE